MTIGRAIFLRPIEITTSSKDLTVNSTAIALDVGTYANIMTLAYELRTKMRTVSGLSSMTVTFDNSPTSATYGKITLANSGAFSVTWTDTDLRNLLGFSGNLSSATTHTATYRPRYTWFSDYTPRDRECFHLEHKSTFAGSLSRTGELVGLATGPQIFRRMISFDAESYENLFMSAQLSTDEQYYHTLEYFVEQCRSSVPTVATNARTNGFWYCYAPEHYAIVSSMANATNHLEASNYGWAWCHLDPEGMSTPQPSFGVSRDWYSCEVRVHTADVPTWDEP